MLAAVLAKLLAAFPAQAQSDAPAEQRMEAYFEALRDIPAWAVNDAREAIVAGKVADLAGVWAPTPPQLAKAARAAMSTDAGVLADLERIASAAGSDEPSPEERARVSAGFDKLRADLIMSGLKPMDGDAG